MMILSLDTSYHKQARSKIWAIVLAMLKGLLQSLQLAVIVLPCHSLSWVQSVYTTSKVLHHCHWASAGTLHGSKLLKHHYAFPLWYSAAYHCHQIPGGHQLQSDEGPVCWWCKFCFLCVTVELVVCLMLASDLK